MSDVTARRIEAAIDAAAAAALAGAIAFAAVTLLAPGAVWTAAAAGLTFLAAHALLRRVASQPARFALATFAETLLEPNELILTGADRLEQPEEPLVLDDILAAMGPDSRVVRLFNPASMPTAAQLSRRIDRHLDKKSVPPQADASDALHAALDELRRSLR